MIQKARKIGGSLYILIPKTEVEYQSIKENDLLEIELEKTTSVNIKCPICDKNNLITPEVTECDSCGNVLITEE